MSEEWRFEWEFRVFWKVLFSTEVLAGAGIYTDAVTVLDEEWHHHVESCRRMCMLTTTSGSITALSWWSILDRERHGRLQLDIDRTP